MNIEILKAASAAFLCEQLPDNWNDMSEDEQNDFLVCNAWSAVENCSANELWDMIECHASTISNVLDTVHDGIVKMAIDDKLDLDMNALCFDTAIEYSKNNP